MSGLCSALPGTCTQAAIWSCSSSTFLTRGATVPFPGPRERETGQIYQLGPSLPPEEQVHRIMALLSAVPL